MFDRLTPVAARTCGLLGIVAGVCYLVNPFAARLLLPDAPLPAVASELGGIGQPFAAVFNGADIASGAFTLIACACLRVLTGTTRPARLWTASAVALMAQASGTILAALFPLSGHAVDPVHWTLSRLDGGGLLASLLLFAGSRFPRDKWFLAAVLGVGLTFALYQGVSNPMWEGPLQRLCILETACWIGCFPWLSQRALTQTMLLP